MITLRRIQDGFKLEDINIPELEEVSLRSYVMTLKAISKTISMEDNADIVRSYCQALSCWTGQDYELIKSFPFDVVQRGIEIIISTITNKKENFYSNNISFEHKGKRFEIGVIETIANSRSLSRLTAGQAIRILDIMSDISSLIEKEGDEDGSYMYTQYLKLLAILTADSNSAFFSGNILDSEKFIDERVEFFADVRAAPAIAADFFLTPLMKDSEKKGLCIGFLTGLSLLLSLETLPTHRKTEPLK